MSAPSPALPTFDILHQRLVLGPLTIRERECKALISKIVARQLRYCYFVIEVIKLCRANNRSVYEQK